MSTLTMIYTLNRSFYVMWLQQFLLLSLSVCCSKLWIYCSNTLTVVLLPSHSTVTCSVTSLHSSSPRGHKHTVFQTPSNSCFYCVVDTNMNTLFVPVTNNWHEVDTTVGMICKNKTKQSMAYRARH